MVSQGSWDICTATTVSLWTRNAPGTPGFPVLGQSAFWELEEAQAAGSWVVIAHGCKA